MVWLGPRAYLAALLIAVTALAAGATAGPVDPPGDDEVASQVLAGPGATQAGYTTPVAAVGAGTGLTFQNLDLPQHNVVATHEHHADGDEPWCDQFDDGHCPAFWSPLIGLGSSTPVLGVGELEVGTYGFYCTAHPWMTGTLVVGPQGVTVSQEQLSLAPHPTLEMVE